MSGNGQSSTRVYNCSRPACPETGIGPEVKKSSIFSVFKPKTEVTPNSPQKGFCFGGRWFCSKDCLKWAMGEEIGHLFHHSSERANLSRARLGTILRARDRISKEQLEKALEKQEELGGKLGEWLVRLNHISEDEVIACLAQQLKIPWIEELEQVPNERALSALPPYLCKELTLLPLEFHKRSRLMLAVDYSFTRSATRLSR
jgi:hypothetical protein